MVLLQEPRTQGPLFRTNTSHCLSKIDANVNDWRCRKVKVLGGRRRRKKVTRWSLSNAVSPQRGFLKWAAQLGKQKVSKCRGRCKEKPVKRSKVPKLHLHSRNYDSGTRIHLYLFFLSEPGSVQPKLWARQARRRPEPSAARAAGFTTTTNQPNQSGSTDAYSLR